MKHKQANRVFSKWLKSRIAHRFDESVLENLRDSHTLSEAIVAASARIAAALTPQAKKDE